MDLSWENAPARKKRKTCLRVSPNRQEMEITLINKTRFVCNFYPEAWSRRLPVKKDWGVRSTVYYIPCYHAVLHSIPMSFFAHERHTSLQLFFNNLQSVLIKPEFVGIFPPLVSTFTLLFLESRFLNYCIVFSSCGASVMIIKGLCEPAASQINASSIGHSDERHKQHIRRERKGASWQG